MSGANTLTPMMIQMMIMMMILMMIMMMTMILNPQHTCYEYAKLIYDFIENKCWNKFSLVYFVKSLDVRYILKILSVCQYFHVSVMNKNY